MHGNGEDGQTVKKLCGHCGKVFTFAAIWTDEMDFAQWMAMGQDGWSAQSGRRRGDTDRREPTFDPDLTWPLCTQI